MTKKNDYLPETKAALDCLEEHKGEDIVRIDVSETSPFARDVILATMNNPRALGAMQDHLEETFEGVGAEIFVKEGEPDSGWIIIQGGEAIVHLMLPGHRRAINLEGLLAELSQRAH